MAYFLNKNLPANATHRDGECMASAMLSVLQTFKPDTTLRARELCVAKASNRQGITILEAALMFNAMGIPSAAFTRTYSSVATPTSVFRNVWQIGKIDLKRVLLKRQLHPTDLKKMMSDQKAIVICCTEEGTDTHAHLLTGFTREHFVYHDSRSSLRTRSGHGFIPHATPNALMHEDDLWGRWHGHEYHTVVVFPPRDSPVRDILYWEISLKDMMRYCYAVKLKKAGKPYEHLTSSPPSRHPQRGQAGRDQGPA